jgi:hypothetical protein
MFENLTNNSENYVTKAARTKIQNWFVIII